MTSRIYYTGDMANQPGWFQVIESDTLRMQLREEVAAGEQPRSFSVARHHIGDVYHGHCNPRFVTEKAYNAFRATRQQLTDTERSVLTSRENTK